MRTIIITLLLSGLFFTVQAQVGHRPVKNPALKNMALPRYVNNDVRPAHFLNKPANPATKSALNITETSIGATKYDLQTNSSVQNRIYRFEDGTISGTWTIGMANPNFADRGTGYNYYDGTSWGAEPTVRIESIRAGWPSIFPLGANGEGVISHDFSEPGGLILVKRANKGTGTWEEDTIGGITGQMGPSWHRAVSSGTGHNTIHMISLTRPVANNGNLYQGLDGALLYSRSSDEGATWDIPYTVLPGMTSSDYTGFGGDAYAMAEPKGNTVAFVVGDSWTDMFLMKSTDNGASWNKTVIFQHPYPLFQEAHTMVTDTPWVCDGSVSVSLDNNGKAHVFFGLMRVLNADTTDAQTSYFPYTDGLAYWNEDLPVLTTLNYDSLDLQGRLVGWVQDLNNNDTIFEFVNDESNPPKYYMSLTSMPGSCIDPNGNIYLTMTSLMEWKDNGVQNYRHILARVSSDGGQTWSGFKDITGGLIHNFHECVYPSVAAGGDDKLHVVYQYDEEPGIAVNGDTDPYTDNTIAHLMVPKADLLSGIEGIHQPLHAVSQNFPNPFTGKTQVMVDLGRSEPVTLKVMTTLGQVVETQDLGRMDTGKHLLTIDATNYKPGMYFFSLQIGDETFTRSMIVQ